MRRPDKNKRAFSSNILLVKIPGHGCIICILAMFSISCPSVVYPLGILLSTFVHKIGSMMPLFQLLLLFTVIEGKTGLQYNLEIIFGLPVFSLIHFTENQAICFILWKINITVKMFFISDFL